MSRSESPVATGRDLRSLRYTEHFLAWAVRTSVACSPHCRMLQREFAHAFGPDPVEGITAFHGWLIALSKGRRKLEIGRPGLIELTRDEELMLALLGAAQASEETRFMALGRFVMGAEPGADLYEAARGLMTRLVQRGHALPERPLPEVVPCAGVRPMLKAV
ncbi:MAG: hypothetical protein QM667_05985 [Asticcacaulis sp.]